MQRSNAQHANVTFIRRTNQRTNENDDDDDGDGWRVVDALRGIGSSALSPGIFFDDFQAKGWSVLVLALVPLPLLLCRSIHAKTNARDCTGFTCRNAHRSIIPFGWVRRWSLLLRREYQQGVVDRSGKALGCPSVERGGDATRCRW